MKRHHMIFSRFFPSLLLVLAASCSSGGGGPASAEQPFDANPAELLGLLVEARTAQNDPVRMRILCEYLHGERADRAAVCVAVAAFVRLAKYEIEDDAIGKDLGLATPVPAMRTVSHDPTCRATIERLDGSRCTA